MTNAHAGVFMMGATNFDLFRNTIEDNGPLWCFGIRRVNGHNGFQEMHIDEESKQEFGFRVPQGLTIGYDATGTPAELQRVPK